MNKRIAVRAERNEGSTRQSGKCVRHHFTDTLKKAGLTRGYEYAAVSDTLNKPLLGMTAREWKAQHELARSAPVRDHLDDVTLSTIALGEALAGKRIATAGATGVQQCVSITHEVAIEVAVATATLRE